jgi:hypothetical protein
MKANNMDKQLRIDVNKLDCSINLVLEILEESQFYCDADADFIESVYHMQEQISTWQERSNYI